MEIINVCWLICLLIYCWLKHKQAWTEFQCLYEIIHFRSFFFFFKRHREGRIGKTERGGVKLLCPNCLLATSRNFLWDVNFCSHPAPPKLYPPGPLVRTAPTRKPRRPGKIFCESSALINQKSAAPDACRLRAACSGRGFDVPQRLAEGRANGECFRWVTWGVGMLVSLCDGLGCWRLSGHRPGSGLASGSSAKIGRHRRRTCGE